MPADRAGALDALEDALASAADEGLLAPFLAAPDLADLLDERIAAGTAAQSFAVEAWAGVARRKESSDDSGLVLVPLTEREMGVLRYLPTRMTTNEIADTMYVSVNTVKTHLQSVYRKLAATSRQEAVDHARRLGLI